MFVKGLQSPRDLTIDFAPSPKQYELWKLLQPNYCPHCGGEIELKLTSYDMKGMPATCPRLFLAEELAEEARAMSAAAG